MDQISTYRSKKKKLVSFVIKKNNGPIGLSYPLLPQGDVQHNMHRHLLYLAHNTHTRASATPWPIGSWQQGVVASKRNTHTPSVTTTQREEWRLGPGERS